jgi:hypothetical protein
MEQKMTGSSDGRKAEDIFWRWFEDNQLMLKDFENDQDNVIEQLVGELTKVHEDLTFEMSSEKDNGKRDFIISAGGIKSAFPSVEALHDAAPELKDWDIIKFRPRRIVDHSIKLGDRDISYKDVYFRLYPDEKLKVGVVIYIEGFNESEFNVFANIGFLFLDLILGEYDVETKVGHIDFDSTEAADFGKARPVINLASEFDVFYSSIIN